jgi:hypothetical protein
MPTTAERTPSAAVGNDVGKAARVNSLEEYQKLHAGIFFPRKIILRRLSRATAPVKTNALHDGFGQTNQRTSEDVMIPCGNSTYYRSGVRPEVELQCHS